jgi:hypothetical protein
MNQMQRTFVWVSFTGLSLCLTACGGPAGIAVNRDLNEQGVPNWVAQGTSTVKTVSARLFYGVGVASDVGDFSVQVSIAERRAKREIERMLDRYLQVVLRDYIASGQAAAYGVSHAQLQQEVEEVGGAGVPGIEIVELWHDKTNNKIFTVAQLQLQLVKEHIRTANTVSAGLLGYINSDGAKIFDRIAQNSH